MQNVDIYRMNLNLTYLDALQSVNMVHFEKCYMHILTATDDKVLLDKYINVKFHLDSKCFGEHFCVVSGANAHSFMEILRTSFLTDNKVVIHCRTNSLGFEVEEASVRFEGVSQSIRSLGGPQAG